MRIFGIIVLICLGLSLVEAAIPNAQLFKVTHGPLLGQPGTDSMTVWVRTDKPAEVTVRYGKQALNLNLESKGVQSELAHDNTATIQLTGLESNTLYYYQVSNSRPGSFRTMPDSKEFVDPELNPEGLFNFQFFYSSCGNQNAAGGVGPGMPVYDILNDEFREEVLFGIFNGDWIYEEDRDYPVEAWKATMRIDAANTPEIVDLAPPIVGVWENYKTYMDRGLNMSEWHQHIPTFYTFDDHELLNDIYGTGEIGYVDRRAVFRDTGVQAWMDYLGWANPFEHEAVARFGRVNFEKGSSVLYDPQADFSSMDLKDHGTLMVHWGLDTDGIPAVDLDRIPGNPNAGVYGVEEVIDRHRVRISPPAREDGEAVYSIGRRSYGSFDVGNCTFILLDTRSHRTLHDVSQPDKPGASILGKQQFQWLQDTIDHSEADFFFLVSSVDFMIPHVGNGGGNDMNISAAKDDAWTVFLEEREELIEFCSERSKQQFFLLTGDLHNSFAIHITDNVWEFASGPANSINHVPENDEGGRPANGKFKYGPRECDIRWSTYIEGDIPRLERKYPTFCIVQINNVFNNPVQREGERWVAYPHPQVLFKYFDGFTGDFLYSESIVAGMEN